MGETGRLSLPAALLTLDERTLRAYLEAASVPPLLMTMAHLTGEAGFLSDELRPTVDILARDGGLSPERCQQAREQVLAGLLQLRNGESRALAEPDAEIVDSIVRWTLGDDADEFAPLLIEELALGGMDPKAPRWSQRDIAPDRDFEVAIIGAGMSGLLAAHRMAQAGLRFTIYEQNADVGGTWLENVYPGCRVDVANHLFSYSFFANDEWPDHFCAQPVLFDYFRAFAEAHGLRERIRFETTVECAAWDDDTCTWTLQLRTTSGQETSRVDAVVCAVGQLNRPSYPEIDGRDSFLGPSFHSARWDHSVELAGKRVAVIGSGASAFQFVPEIAARTGELLVFQRTPPWLLPTPNYRSPIEVGVQWLFRNLPGYSTWYRYWLFVPGLRGLLEAALVDPDHPPTERSISAVNEQYRRLISAAMEAQLEGAEELREHVIPKYPFAAKRMLRDDGSWIATLRREDVRLVSERIVRITEQGIVTADGTEHAVDVIVYGTGFQASRFLSPMRITGRGAIDLHEEWKGEARAYLGVTIRGFPNLFCIYGPNTNLVVHGGSVIFFSECAVTYVMNALDFLLRTGADALDVREEPYDAYNRRIDEANARCAWGWSEVPTWYRGPHGRSAQNWPLPALEYWQRTHRIVADDYERITRSDRRLGRDPGVPPSIGKATTTKAVTRS